MQIGLIEIPGTLQEKLSLRPLRNSVGLTDGKTAHRINHTIIAQTKYFGLNHLVIVFRVQIGPIRDDDVAAVDPAVDVVHRYADQFRMPLQEHEEIAVTSA